MDRYRWIGIITKNNYDCSSTFIRDDEIKNGNFGMSYWYRGGWKQSGLGSIDSNDRQWNGMRSDGISQWEKGEIVTMEINCVENKVCFSKNNRRMGAIDIAPNGIYYPAMVLSPFVGNNDFSVIYK